MAIYDEWGDPVAPPTFPSQPAAPKSNGCLKVFLILAVLFGGGAATCCCGGILVTWWFMEKGVSQEPAAVRQATKEIAGIKIPEDFEPVVSINLFYLVRLVVYQSPQSEARLMLAEFHNSFSPNEQDHEARMNDLLENQGHMQPRHLEQLHSEMHEYEIGGEKVEFEFAESKDTDSGKEYRQVSGKFAGKKGRAVLVLQVPAEKYDEEQVQELLKSIK